MRLIDADSVKDFFFLGTSGTEETIRDLAEKHNLTYLNNVNEDEVESFAKDLLKGVQNVLDTESIAYDVDKVVEQLEKLKSQVPEELNQLMAYDEAIEIVKAGGKNGIEKTYRSDNELIGNQRYKGITERDIKYL